MGTGVAVKQEQEYPFIFFNSVTFSHEKVKSIVSEAFEECLLEYQEIPTKYMVAGFAEVWYIDNIIDRAYHLGDINDGSGEESFHEVVKGYIDDGQKEELENMVWDVHINSGGLSFYEGSLGEDFLEDIVRVLDELKLTYSNDEYGSDDLELRMVDWRKIDIENNSICEVW